MDRKTKQIFYADLAKNGFRQWTFEETVYKKKEKMLEAIKDLNLPFRAALAYKVKKTFFGSFLQELNTTQNQDAILNENKMQILNWQLKRYNNHDLAIIENRNNIFTRTLDLLKEAVNQCDVIDMSFLQKKLGDLSLNCCFIKYLDPSLKYFRNLQILIICGNYLTDVTGSILPIKLIFLELFDNFIVNFKNLTKNPPKSLLHLGLGRNGISDGSYFHLLSKTQNFRDLKSLDLSDNDICDLNLVLMGLEHLKSLTALGLEGNPCTVTPDYKNEVMRCLPNLIYLDQTEILDEDKIILEKIDRDECFPQVIFMCHRILGLPEPPKDPKNIQTIHLEVYFPLLIEKLEIDEEEINENPANGNGNSKDEEIEKKQNGKGKQKKNKKEKEEKPKKKNKTEQVSIKGKNRWYYGKANEYDPKFEKRNLWLKTDRVPWSKDIQFPAIAINSPKNDLALVRDSFRSIIPVRIVYLKMARNNPQQKKHKDSKVAKKQIHSTKEETDPSEMLSDTHLETVLKKITLASFYCELKSVNWSDETLDFYWADHPDIGDFAIRVNGSLKAIEYDLSTDAKKNRNKIATPKENEMIPTKELLPKVFTCQVGFGLHRY